MNVSFGYVSGCFYSNLKQQIDLCPKFDINYHCLVKSDSSSTAFIMKDVSTNSKSQMLLYLNESLFD